mgnify:FL=1
MAKDLVIGFITGYQFSKLKPWIHSLNESGFEGDKILFCYGISDETIEEIHSHGITTIQHPRYDPESFNIVVHRFYHLWEFLREIKEKNQKYRYVITTDVADVIFQRNPSEWFDSKNEIFGVIDILSSSEGLKYCDEPWGENNMRLSFGPRILEDLSERRIFNAGVIAGKHDFMRDLSLSIFQFCRSSPLYVPGGGGPDQAAYNVIVNMEPWWDCLTIADHYDGWACQCGTTVDPNKIDGFRPNLLECEPVWDGEFAKTPYGEKYVIVHQYNRIPEWKEVIEKRYDR